MRQFRPEDTSPWHDRYGSGGGGVKHVTTNETYDGAVSGLVGTYTVDGNPNPTITIDAASTFANGMLVRIMQARGGILNTGWDRNWEWNKIKSGGGTTTLVLEYPLDLPYQDDGSGAANQAMITEAKSYSSLEIDATKSLSPIAWNGNEGGDLPIFVTGIAQGPGKLNVAGLGFRGGDATGGSATSGEGWPDGINHGTSPNGNGGGGGVRTPQDHGNSGAGGAGATTASDGAQHNEFSLDSGVIATGGSSFGDSECKLVVFGGGSGGGGHDSGAGSTSMGDGKPGGGFCSLFAGEVKGTLEISLDGSAATRYTDTGHCGAGGGGGAGSFFGGGQIVAVGASMFHATGGASEWGCSVQHSNISSAGTDGRFRIHYSNSISGSLGANDSSTQSDLYSSLYAHESIFSTINPAQEQLKYQDKLKVASI